MSTTFSFNAFSKFCFVHIGFYLCSQTNGNTQVKLMDIEWGLDGTQHKRIFPKLIFAATFVTCCNHKHFFFIGIIYKMYVIIDDSVYFDPFLLCSLDTKHARISFFYYLLL